MVDSDRVADLPEGVEVDELTERVTEQLDPDGLRMVGYFAAKDFDVEYVRDDVREEIAQSHEDALRDAVLESLSMEYLEDYFADDIVGTTRIFETKAVVYCRASELQGIVVSLDREAECPQQILTALEELIR